MDGQQARALVERQARAWEAQDIEAVLADFTSDGVLSSPGGRWQGHNAIRQAARLFFARVSDVQVRVTHVLLDGGGTQGAAEWTWSETRADGSRHIAEDAIIFELRHGKILSWREYFDTASF